MNVVILGAGGFGREVQQLLKDVNRHNDAYGLGRLNLLGFVDEDKHLLNSVIHGAPVLGDTGWFEKAARDIRLILGVGAPQAKRKFVAEGTQAGLKFVSLIHPNVAIGENVRIGAGVIIAAFNFITADVVIEDYAMINGHCTIGHDCVIGRFATVSPNSVLSITTVGEGAFLGMHVTTVAAQGRRYIGSGSVIGAGAVVTHDIPAGVVAAGIPARVIKPAP